MVHSEAKTRLNNLTKIQSSLHGFLHEMCKCCIFRCVRIRAGDAENWNRVCVRYGLLFWHTFGTMCCFFDSFSTSHPEGLDVWFLVGPFVYFHTSCVLTVKALGRLRRCTCSPEPSLVAYVTIISWADSYVICFHGLFDKTLHITLVMRKPVYAIYEQQRRKSACASAQSDQHLCCSLPR